MLLKRGRACFQVRAMDKHRNDLFQIEAFFYGLAGLLEDTFLKRKRSQEKNKEQEKVQNKEQEKEQEDEYSVRLCKEFRYLQRKFEITRVMDATLWRFLRLRPENFPHIRLAQLAYLYQKGDKLFSRLLEAETLPEVRELLTTRTSVYWEGHFIISGVLPHRRRTIGREVEKPDYHKYGDSFLYTYGLHKCGRADV